jgi:hypothetical protein
MIRIRYCPKEELEDIFIVSWIWKYLICYGEGELE